MKNKQKEREKVEQLFWYEIDSLAVSDNDKQLMLESLQALGLRAILRWNKTSDRHKVPSYAVNIAYFACIWKENLKYHDQVNDALNEDTLREKAQVINNTIESLTIAINEISKSLFVHNHPNHPEASEWLEMLTKLESSIRRQVVQRDKLDEQLSRARTKLTAKQWFVGGICKLLMLNNIAPTKPSDDPDNKIPLERFFNVYIGECKSELRSVNRTYSGVTKTGNAAYSKQEFDDWVKQSEKTIE
ncbi:hypothetical protein L4C34_06005 [Vibrio profundum]|uniref:hypothetical protein n=1 Tax=Vibrio profundum TaxID=2910247 RepID=UPI003D11FE07